MVADNNINGSKNVKILLYNHDYDDTVYLTFSVRFGFAYRYISFSRSTIALEINQAFANIYVNYLRILCKKKYDKDIYTNVYRGSFTVSLISDLQNVNGDISFLYSVMFDSQIDKLIFNDAKIKFDEDFCNAYKYPINKAMYHMLEYSDSNKKFDFYKFSKDIRSLENETFIKYVTTFVRPDNTLITIAGKIEAGNTIHIPETSSKKVITKSFSLCYIKRSSYKAPAVAKRISADIDFTMGCVKFHFNSNIELVKKYLLLKMMAEIVFGHNYEVNVDSADATIIYWNCLENISEMKFNGYLLNDLSVEASKARILNQISNEMEMQPVRFYQNWSNNYLYKINIDEFVNDVSLCSAVSLQQLYEQLQPIINEGEVILNQENLILEEQN